MAAEHSVLVVEDDAALWLNPGAGGNHEIWEMQGLGNDERASDQATLRTMNVLRMALARREEAFQIIDQASDESTAMTHLSKMEPAQSNAAKKPSPTPSNRPSRRSSCGAAKTIVLEILK